MLQEVTLLVACLIFALLAVLSVGVTLELFRIRTQAVVMMVLCSWVMTIVALVAVFLISGDICNANPSLCPGW